MKKILAILLGAIVWLGGGGVAWADGMVLPLPGLAGSETYGVAVRYHHVTVTIEDGYAVTRVEQAFYNPHEVPVTGRYLFPVPPDAMLTGFQVTVDQKAQEAVRQDAAATNAELYALVAEQHDPSLLQYADWESLAFNLDLPAGGSRVMALEYEEVLSPSGGLYRYRYVLSTERYSSLPLFDVAVAVDLSMPGGLSSVYSPSHAVTVERSGPGEARVTWDAERTRPTEDFELFFAPAEGGFGGGLLTGERNGRDHLLFSFSPEGSPQQASVLPKDLVLVMDHSGSMSGEKIEQARHALQFILGQLGEADRFALVGFAERPERLSVTLQPADERALGDARRFVDDLVADGSTDLYAALQTGLEILDRSESRDALQMVVFLTDGLPTAGITDGGQIAEMVAEANRRGRARIHAFGVGYDVNTHLLDRLAADNGGTVTYVQPGENLEWVLTGFYARIAHPVLTDVRVAFDGMEVEDAYPQALPDLFEGSSLLLAGRFHATADTVAVRIRGRAGDEWREFVYRFDLAETGGHDFVPRLWATRRIGALLDVVRVEGETEALAEEIRGLGLGYGIATPYTTFVIEAQVEGVASAANMDLYNQVDLNSISGETTVQARVQNQMYQQAEQANLADGANVSNIGARSLARIGVQQVDLALLQEQWAPSGPVTEGWLTHALQPDRTVVFGSEAYFRLADNAEVRLFLQGGPNVIFRYEGETIAVHDPGDAPSGAVDPAGAPQDNAPVSDSGGQTDPQAPAAVRGESGTARGVMLLGAAGVGLMAVAGAILVVVVRMVVRSW